MAAAPATPDGKGTGPDEGTSGPARRKGPGWFSALARTPSLVAGIVLLGLYATVGALSPLLYPGNPASLPIHVATGYTCPPISAPTLQLWPFSRGAFPLGQTGGLGFNVLEGLVKGTPYDLLLLLEIIVPAVLVGLVVGTVAGLRGGLLDEVLMALTDSFLAVPEFVVVALASIYVLEWVDPGLRLWVFGLLVLSVVWAPYARVVRARARTVSQLPYVEAARAAGASDSRLALRHVLPNSAYPVFAQVPTTLASVLTILGGLQYAYTLANPGLCHGLVGPPYAMAPLPFLPSYHFPEWTWVLANGASAWTPLASANPWWGVIFPALWILVFGLGVILTCDGLDRLLSVESRD